MNYCEKPITITKDIVIKPHSSTIFNGNMNKRLQQLENMKLIKIMHIKKS